MKLARANKITFSILSIQTLRNFSSWQSFKLEELDKPDGVILQNLVEGQWVGTQEYIDIQSPLNGKVIVKCPDTKAHETSPFIKSMQKVPLTGLHNPYKNPQRYVQFGEIFSKVAQEMRKPKVADFFAQCIQRVVPKSYPQCMAEVTVTRKFFENYSGDQVRFTAKGFIVSGDHMGQQSHGLRFPFGSVAIITPFNFPLEISSIQLCSALMMGNKPVLHADNRVSLVSEQFVRLLHYCGLKKDDCDMIHGRGKVVGEMLEQIQPRNTLFTGSSTVAQHLVQSLKGKVVLEDAGFDWKILGPDVKDIDYVVHQSDQDAYGASGQKCSAQSILFAHSKWIQQGLLKKLKTRAKQRNLEDLTVGPILTWTTQAMKDHIDRLVNEAGGKILFGGQELKDHNIPKQYGAIEPTAVQVGLEKFKDHKLFKLATTEVFGPVQVIVEYDDQGLDSVLEVINAMDHHLTAGVVSNDQMFIDKVLGNTVNGTTYAGIRAKTTGAPQNHWFGPSGSPLCAGIHTPEAIRQTWTCHREVVYDMGPCPDASSLKQS